MEAVNIERQRQRERESWRRQKKTDRDRERKRNRKTESDSDMERDRGRPRHREGRRETEREGERDRQRESNQSELLNYKQMCILLWEYFTQPFTTDYIVSGKTNKLFIWAKWRQRVVMHQVKNKIFPKIQRLLKSSLIFWFEITG